MKNKIFLYFLLIGALISPLRADLNASSPSPTPDDPEPTDAVAAETVTYPREARTEPGTSATTKLVLQSTSTTARASKEIANVTRNWPETNDPAAFKPLKIKKKVLISNLKNVTEKVTSGGIGDKQHDKTIFVRTSNVTEESPSPTTGANATESNGDRPPGLQNETVVADEEEDPTVVSEARSFQDVELRRKTTGSYKYFNRRNKVTTSTTETYGSKLTTSSFTYYTHGEVQKGVNNNYLNVNEDSEGRVSGSSVVGAAAAAAGAVSTTPTVSLRSEPSSTISNGNSVKNLVRLENDYYGPTHQTDWVPIVPIKTERRTTSTTQRGPTVKANATTATTTTTTTTSPTPTPATPTTTTQRPQTIRQITARRRPTTTTTESSNDVKTASSVTTTSTTTTPASNAIPILDLDEGSSRSTLEYRKVNRTSTIRRPETPKPNKFRGSIRYRPSNVSSSDAVNIKPNETRPISNATEDGLQKLEVTPVTGWDMSSTFSSGRIPPSTEANVTITTRRTTSTTSTTVAPRNVTLADVIKPKNIAKVQVLKNTISDKVASDNPMSMFKFTETEPPANISKAFETSTEVVIPTTTEPTTTFIPVVVTLPLQQQSTTSTGKPPDERQETEVTFARDLPKINATAPNVSEVTTVREEPPPPTTTMSTEEMTTVAETEKEVVFTTEEPVPDTTIKAATEQDAEVSTDIPPEDVPVPINSSSTTTAAAHESVTEKETTTQMQLGNNTMTTTTMTIQQEEHEHPHHHPGSGMHPRHEITEENVPAYLKLTVEAASWEELCRLKDDLRYAIIRMLDGTNVTEESIVFLNLNEKNCRKKIEETRNDPPSNVPVYLPVNMFIMNESGDFDKNLSEAFLNVWGQYGLDFELPIRKVDFLSPLGGLYDLPNDSVGVSVIAAIVISCVAGLCVILLGILFVIMKRRQKRFNYGQRCTPVSLDAYSLDSVSIHNSVRRKGIRTSKRSYGNAAFDDPEVPSHSMNFAGLANFSSDKEQLHEEFNIIPQVYPKVDELPPGAETKNRYANVIPLPETRVHLSVKDGDTLSDYVNANYVRGLKGAEKLYIACQAPMESTVEDFWRMIWEQQCKVILMLTDLQENGVEKCTDYLPPNEVTDNLRLFGDFQITMKKRDVKEKYVISHLKLKNMEANLWREVTHLWYLGWPEQGVPSEANSLIAFLIEARSQMKSQTGSAVPGPAVVHCSPGTGRTGTVIACDLCIREFEQTRMVDIPKCVFNLRKDRAGSVQTKDQYAFIYQVLNVYATKLTGGGLESI